VIFQGAEDFVRIEINTGQPDGGRGRRDCGAKGFVLISLRCIDLQTWTSRIA
jgi:hypothetical protein